MNIHNKVSDKDTVIPKTIYYTWKDNNFTDSIKKIIEKNKKLNPDYQFRFYDDYMCEKFIKDNFDERTYNAYMTPNPKLGASKADFWRYCVIYINGGIYIDIKIEITKSLASIIRENDECILDKPRCLELYRSTLDYPFLIILLVLYFLYTKIYKKKKVRMNKYYIRGFI